MSVVNSGMQHVYEYVPVQAYKLEGAELFYKAFRCN